MRIFLALLFIGGGGIAALALSWFFYSTSVDEQQFNDEQTAQTVTSGPVTSEPVTAEPVTGETDADIKAPPADAQPEADDNSDKAGETATAEEADRLAGLPRVELARIGPDGSAVLAGIADSRSTITISENGKKLGGGRADASGEWVAILDDPLSAGNHLLIVEMLTTDGQMRRDSRAVLVELQDTGKDTPLVALVPMDDTAQAQAEIISAPEGLNVPQADDQHQDADNAGSSEASRAQTEPVDEPDLSINTLSWISQDSLLIRGSAQAGAQITGRFGDADFTAEYDRAQQLWNARLTVPEKGDDILRLETRLLSEAGETLKLSVLDIAISQLDIGRDGSEMVVVSKGDMLWRIAYRTYGRGIRYLDIVKRNKDRIDNPDMIFPAQIFALPE